jgi:hypothetical protein
LVYAYPKNNEKHVRTVGKYYFVFNKKLEYNVGDNVVASFNAQFFSSGETLYVVRTLGKIPIFERRDTIYISTLTDAEGYRERLDIGVVFTTAKGETENNDLPELSDTLRADDVRDGIIGKDDNEPSDKDYFTVVPDTGQTLKVRISTLDQIPVICVLSDTAYDLPQGSSTSFNTPDTLLFHMTNRYYIGSKHVIYSKNGWYRISVVSLND